jgi:hypothetical protein
LNSGLLGLISFEKPPSYDEEKMVAMTTASKKDWYAQRIRRLQRVIK